MITGDMNVIENTVYHNPCLFYKGELSLEEMLGDDADSPTGAAAAYGIANWYYYNGDKEEAQSILESLLATDGWSAFGYIAAEADLARLRQLKRVGSIKAVSYGPSAVNLAEARVSVRSSVYR